MQSASIHWSSASRNYSEIDQKTDKPFTSKALKDCYYQGAEKFGWSKRKPEPRSMREGRELVGYGMATGIWEALRVPTSAEGRARSGRHTRDR